MPLLPALTIAAALAGQPQPAVSPYLEAVRRYGPGHEREAIEALRAAGLRTANTVFAELDDRVCVSAGAASCDPRRLAAAGIGVRERIDAEWRRLYPRALGLHLEALAAGDPDRDRAAMTIHKAVLVHMAVRLEQIAREPDVPDDFVELAQTARRLLLWTLQFLQDEPGLASTIQAFTAAKVTDPELSLARGLLEELRAGPEKVAASPGGLYSGPHRGTFLASEERRHRTAALEIYLDALKSDAGLVAAHLRAGRLLAWLDRADEAQPHLERVVAAATDTGTRYLATIFLADVLERRGRGGEARAAYESALRLWPGAQVPVVALARLRLLDGAPDAARATLDAVYVEREMRERSDPWMGYIGGQGWRLPDAIKALQASFEPLP